MSKLRSVSTSFWSDPFIEDLTPSQKLLFLYLITNEKTNMLGIYESSIKKISFETSINKDDVKKGLEVFEKLGKVKYINNYVILVNYMKHQNFNTNMKKSAIDIYNSLPNELIDSSIVVSKDNPLKGFETLLNHFGMVRKVETEYEVEDETKDEIEIEGEEPLGKVAKFSFKESLITYGFKKELVEDWLKVRKTKKATNTETAYKSFLLEVEKKECDINELLTFIISKDWKGFKWEWIEKEKSSDKKESQVGRLLSMDDSLSKKIEELHKED